MGSSSEVLAVIPFATSEEHLAAELEYFDRALELLVHHGRLQQPPGPLDAFRGMVLSDEEILGLLNAPAGLEEGHRASLEAHGARLRARRQASPRAFPLIRLSGTFGLCRLEEQCLVACLAVEVDSKYEKLYAYLQDNVTRRKPGVELILDLLCATMGDKLQARRAFEAASPLLRYRLLHAGDPEDVPLPSRSFQVDERVVSYLFDIPTVDSRIPARLTAPAAPAECHASLCRTLHDLLPRNRCFLLRGPYGVGRRSLAQAVAWEARSPLLRVDARRTTEESWLLACREAVLQEAILCVEEFDVLLDERRAGQLDRMCDAIGLLQPLTFLIGHQAWQRPGFTLFDLEVPRPDRPARTEIWRTVLDGDAETAASLARSFQLTPGQILEAAAQARRVAPGPPDRATLHAACRAMSGQRLGSLGQKLGKRFRWSDIILPADLMLQLREVFDRVSCRDQVLFDWGFDSKLSLGRGLNVLFSGPPGTGKTMAAEVLSNELGLDAYRIDLSQVVSKYIGETEKNLHHIFAEAQGSNAILFFDEADALFGRRSEIKDAHDRYANIEIAYLLQKMEEYEGVAILATNLRQNMDEAFVRRMQAIVEFPFPDEEQRRGIWSSLFPAAAPLDPDVDFDLLARQVALAGGNLKNIAVTAAFYAARDGGSIHLRHLLQAARREHQKLGRAWSE